MKCIHCQHDSKLKERTNRYCPKCRRQFAFEPREGDPVTDMLFHNAIQAVSGEGRIHWGVEHLYYEVCRRSRRQFQAGCLVFPVFIMGIAVLAHLTKKIPREVMMGVVAGVLAVVLVYVLGSWLLRVFGGKVRFSLGEFNNLWTRWTQVKGKPPGLIERVIAPPVPTDLEDDIGDYSFDRAVICDRARTVDLLLANNFHFENNCAVLSIDGYPKGPFPIVKKMLQQNPKLQVFVIHDCTPGGCRLAQKLIDDAGWFAGRHMRVIDLGLRPRHAKPFKGLYLPAEDSVDSGKGISASEASWLSGSQLELAAIRPEQVLKRLFAGLQAHAGDEPTTADSGGSVTTYGAFDSGGYGGEADGGGSDAFG